MERPSIQHVLVVRRPLRMILDCCRCGASRALLFDDIPPAIVALGGGGVATARAAALSGGSAGVQFLPQATACQQSRTCPPVHRYSHQGQGAPVLAGLAAAFLSLRRSPWGYSAPAGEDLSGLSHPDTCTRISIHQR